MRLRFGFALLALLTLAACTGPQVDSTPAQQTATPEAAHPPRPPRKPPIPSAELGHGEATPTETAHLEPTAPPIDARPGVTAAVEAAVPPVASPSEPINGERLIGLDQTQMRSLLGAPTARAEAAPATIWRYAGRNCELAIYFYLDLQSQVMRVLHYEVKPHDASEHPGSRCLGDLVSTHQANADGAAGADTPR